MGLFSYNKYYKPGKGVEKDEPEKRAFFKFFELFGRKFWRYIQVNLIQFLILLPVILFLLATFYDYFFTVSSPVVVEDELKTVSIIEENMAQYAGQTVYGQVLDHGTLDTADEAGYVSLGLGVLEESDSGTSFSRSDEIVSFYLASEEDLPVYSSEDDSVVDLSADMVIELYITEDGSTTTAVAHTEAATTAVSVESFTINVWTLLLQIATLYYQYIPQVVRNLLLLASCICFGPIKAGITYVLRNFSLQQHAWMSDVMEKARENWKQGVLVGILDFVILGLFVFDITFSGGDSISSEMLMVVKYVSVLVAMIYCIMRKYLYLMMVTVNLTNSALFQNAWLLTFLGAGRNVMVTLGNFIIWLVFFAATIAINHLIELLLPLLLFSFTGFLNVSVCYPLVNKYLVIPIREMQQQAASRDSLEAAE